MSETVSTITIDTFNDKLAVKLVRTDLARNPRSQFYLALQRSLSWHALEFCGLPDSVIEEKKRKELKNDLQICGK